MLLSEDCCHAQVRNKSCPETIPNPKNRPERHFVGVVIPDGIRNDPLIRLS
jgi:hypothetical protein